MDIDQWERYNERKSREVWKPTIFLSGGGLCIGLHVIDSEKIDMQNEVTSRAVESGVDVADHIRHQPLTISITGVIGNSPEDPNRAEQTYVYLKQAWQQDELFTYSGNLEVLDDMAIVSISPSRSVEVSDGFAVDIQLSQVQTVQAKNSKITGTVVIPKTQQVAEAAKANKQGQKQTKKGNSSSSKKPSAVDQKLNSIQAKLRRN